MRLAGLAKRGARNQREGRMNAKPRHDLVDVLNDTFAFEPEHGVAVAVSHIVAAIRVLRVADPDLLLNHVLELSDALCGIDDLVIQTAEVQQARRKYAAREGLSPAT